MGRPVMIVYNPPQIGAPVKIHLGMSLALVVMPQSDNSEMEIANRVRDVWNDYDFISAERDALLLTHATAAHTRDNLIDRLSAALDDMVRAFGVFAPSSEGSYNCVTAAKEALAAAEKQRMYRK